MLTSAMQAAIPIWIAKWKQQPWEMVWKRLGEQTKTLPDMLGSKGEILMFGGGKKGEATKLFNETAEAVALMSFLPGGIDIFGDHWETDHPGKDE